MNKMIYAENDPRNWTPPPKTEPNLHPASALQRLRMRADEAHALACNVSANVQDLQDRLLGPRPVGVEAANPAVTVSGELPNLEQSLGDTLAMLSHALDRLLAIKEEL